MYCIFVFNNTGITKCESINTKDYDDFASATNTLDKIVAVDTCFAMVRDAMNELVKYHEGDNCRKNTEGIWKDLFKAERKVRSVLFEIRAYHEHMINVLSKTKRKKYAHEVENAKNSDPLFAFVWELRNYVTHFHKVVDHFDDDKNGNSHPFPDVAELLKYKGKNGRGWSTQTRQYIISSNGSIDLLATIQKSFDILFLIHKNVIKSMAASQDITEAMKLMESRKQYIMHKYQVPLEGMWQYQIGQIKYTDDQTDVSEDEYHRPTNERVRGFYSVPVNWERITEISKITSGKV